MLNHMILFRAAMTRIGQMQQRPRPQAAPRRVDARAVRRTAAAVTLVLGTAAGAALATAPLTATHAQAFGLSDVWDEVEDIGSGAADAAKSLGSNAKRIGKEIGSEAADIGRVGVDAGKALGKNFKKAVGAEFDPQPCRAPCGPFTPGQWGPKTPAAGSVGPTKSEAVVKPSSQAADNRVEKTIWKNSKALNRRIKEAAGDKGASTDAKAKIAKPRDKSVWGRPLDQRVLKAIKSNKKPAQNAYPDHQNPYPDYPRGRGKAGKAGAEGSVKQSGIARDRSAMGRPLGAAKETPKRSRAKVHKRDTGAKHLRIDKRRRVEAHHGSKRSLWKRANKRRELLIENRSSRRNLRVDHRSAKKIEKRRNRGARKSR